MKRASQCWKRFASTLWKKLEASGERPRLSAPTPPIVWSWQRKRLRGEPAPREWNGWKRLALEHHNFRAALEWLTETGDAEWGLRLGAALFALEMREYLTEGRDRLGKLLRLPAAAAPTKASRSRSFFRRVLAAEQGDYVSADAFIKESLDIARQVHDPQGAAVSLNALAVNARTA